MGNVRLSAAHGARGASSKNPKNRPNKTKGTQSTKRHKIFITWQDLKVQFEKQNRKCFWSGLPIDPEWVYRSYFPLAPSVDRLNCDDEYTPENIAICCRLFNLGRGQCGSDDFLTIMKAISKRGIDTNPEEIAVALNQATLATQDRLIPSAEPQPLPSKDQPLQTHKCTPENHYAVQRQFDFSS